MCEIVDCSRLVLNVVFIIIEMQRLFFWFLDLVVLRSNSDCSLAHPLRIHAFTLPQYIDRELKTTYTIF